MIEFLRTWVELKIDRKAVTALEYGLIAAAIAAVIAGTVFALGNNMKDTFSTINASL